MLGLALPAGSTEILDTCGTGGSGLNTFNTSTASAFVCVAAGQPVAKHGNRAATSACGSADVLEALGIKLELSPEQELQCLKETGFCFMFAPFHHPATKRVVAIRRELGIRTIFNFLGPLSNPAGARFQVVGVSEPRLMRTIAEALQQLGSTQALVVRGEDGLDEISPCSATHIVELRNGEITEYDIAPEDFGLSLSQHQDIEGSQAKEAAVRLREVLSGKESPLRNLIALNAGAGLYVSGKASSIKEGVEQALDVLSGGKAIEVLDTVVATSQRL
jgi:anthranilate phosphoribosyltransferase